MCTPLPTWPTARPKRADQRILRGKSSGHRAALERVASCADYMSIIHKFQEQLRFSILARGLTEALCNPADSHDESGQRLAVLHVYTAPRMNAERIMQNRAA